MKLALLFATLCCGLLLGACADNSLMTDEDYYRAKGPAAHSPDFSNVIPRETNPATGRPY